MTRPDIRLANLKRLIAEFGTIARVAELSETSEKYLSNLLNAGPDGKKLGNRVAEKLETGCCKPPGWMDLPEEIVATEAEKLTATEAELLRRFRTASPEKRRAMMAVARI